MIGEMAKQQEELMLRQAREDDHPMVKELRRRFRDFFLEADELGVFNPPDA